jgi:hypothetical protein
MAVTNQDFTIYQGDEPVLQFTVQDSAGAALDITGATFKWGLARSLAKTSSVSKTSVSGITIIDGPTGRVDVTLLQADTVGLSGIFVHELSMTLGAKENTVSTGTVTINDSTVK